MPVVQVVGIRPVLPLVSQLSHPWSDSAAETPVCSACLPGVIFVLRLVRIKRNLTE